MDKTKMLMTSNEFKTERYQPKKNIIKKNKILKKGLKPFQNSVAIFRLILLILAFFFKCRTARICSRSLLISCAIIVVFLTVFFEILIWE